MFKTMCISVFANISMFLPVFCFCFFNLDASRNTCESGIIVLLFFMEQYDLPGQMGYVYIVFVFLDSSRKTWESGFLEPF